ncbi:MAG: amidohydrolase, partial [Mucilaginibacter sp.]|nr:amidohydrolase [Mucilaginibacter sp.]
MENLKITLFQGYLFWENIDKNLQNISLRLSNIREKTDLIILPEMFNTGFTMNAEKLAEPLNGKTMIWMHKIAQEFDCVVTGSLIIKDGGNFYNRLIWMRADGKYQYYDKRHLFTLAKEQHTYTAGKDKLIVELKGWKICPVICYDLRFPVWLRNVNEAYDLLIVVANWPERRALHWRNSNDDLWVRRRPIRNHLPQCFSASSPKGIVSSKIFIPLSVNIRLLGENSLQR